MKAIFYEQHGTAEVLQVGERPTPEPQDNEVLVEVVATSVNPIDRRLRSGELQEYITRTFPVVPGWDLAGKIAKVGAKVTDWQVGDEVLGLAFTWSIQHGSYAEYCPIDTASITEKPASISFEQAAALPLVSLTAWQALSEFGELKAGQSVFIQAGAGGVGSVAIPMAKHLGAKVYTTTSAKNHDYVKSLGADVIIDYNADDYESALRQHEPNGVDLVLEALLGNGTAEAAIRLTKDGGRVAYMNNEPPEMDEIKLRNIKAEFLHHRPDGAMLRELVDLYESGKISLPKVQVRPLEEAMDAHLESEKGHTQGKIVLRVS
ncbi:NADP-dependent oxidoreductase [Luminiphilus sp.]|jgi:NADPH2:quinone reductase|nr:NADP-dependent oxidoreductase [Luminiphilus sp.]MDA9666679.1 NADP-dependent oxidoreductase [Luminiphilus sp.]